MVTAYGWFAAFAACALVLSYEMDAVLTLLRQ